MRQAIRLAALGALVAPALAQAGKGAVPADPRVPPPVAALCSGDYADFLTAMNRQTRAFEGSAEAGYTYCIRTVATYERVFYGKGGKLRRQYVRHTRHGTGFAYQAKGGEYFVATNEHVAQHPVVTETDGEVEGVPAGSRKVRETVRIVANESDEDDGAQVTLSKVLVDEALDLAVLKTRHPLKVMPYAMGRSSALRVGNAVQVRGYPLGVFAASNTGRVISTGQPDRERGWNHEDFAVDALLNSGNSGSPVFAVSCKTGELELVGIYHAGYKDAQALNVVVAVDQLREPLRTLRPSRREVASEALDRRALVAQLARAPAPFVMPFADRAVRVGLEGETVRFELLDGDFPLTSAAQLTLVDRGDAWQQPAALLVPPRLGEREIPWANLDPMLRDPAQRLHEALWRQLAAVLAYRQVERHGKGTPEVRSALAEASARIRARKGEQREILQSIDLDADELAGVGPPPRDVSVGRAGPASDDR